MSKRSILFICTHNAARSQMAEGLVNQLVGDSYRARSGGTRPGAVHPMAVRAMAEIGIDISGHRSKHLSEHEGQEFDYVITLCSDAEEVCPFFPGRLHIHQGFEDPAAADGGKGTMEAFRLVRDGIRAWVEATFKARGDVR